MSRITRLPRGNPIMMQPPTPDAVRPALALAWFMALALPLAAQHDAAVFRPGSIAIDGRQYPYQLLTPPSSGEHQRLPLVVFLHGAGERGTDNEHQLHWLPRTMADAAHRARYPCYLLAVQCPAEQRWVEVPWAETHSTPMPREPSQPLRAVMAALLRTLAEQPIDATRVYLTGLSMGGYGAFDLACRQPENFAALLPICGGGDERQAARLVGMPTWIWHGDQDKAVPVGRSRTMAAALRQAGGDARYTELQGVGHDSWKQAYGDDGALAWLFAQRRVPAPIADLVPWPEHIDLAAGAIAWRIGSTLRIATTAATAEHAAVFATELERLTGTTVTVTDSEGELRLGHDATLRPGECALAIGADGATLRGGDAHGLAAASAAFLQALRRDDGGWQTPTLTATDAPEFAFRAVMIDCARHFQSLDELRRVIDLCRFYRVPFVQLHLTDHEGFRFASTAFADVVSDEHYTVEQLRDLDAYARARGVTLVPELDVPGHCKALVDGRPDVFALAGTANRGVVNLGRAAARAGIATLLAELCAVFPRSPYLHIGGDEVDLTGVADDPDCVACMQQHGLADPHELMRWFVVQMHDAVNALGKRTLVWEGFSPGGKPAMPADLIVIAWESAYYPPDRLLADGFQVVNASWQPLYVVGGGALPPQSAPRRWSAAHLYRWHPRRWQHFAPQYPSFAGIEAGTDAPVLGAMMCVWEQQDGTAFAQLRERLPAFAERATHADAGRGYADFAARARSADQRLQQVLGHPATPPQADEWQQFVASGPPRVHYRWFTAPAAGFATVPDFATMVAFAEGTQPILRGGARAGPLGVQLTATLDVPRDGDYLLRLESADGPARLFLDDTEVAEHGPANWKGTVVTVPLKKGAVALRIDSAQGFFHTLCRVQWRVPGNAEFTLLDPALRVIER